MARNNKKFDIGEIYPNSPLAEVVCEVRFPGEVSIEAKRDLFFEAIRSDYPSIYVPQVNPSDFYALKPYRFEKENRNAGIALALMRYSYYEREYSGHRSFIKEFVRIGKLLIKFYKIDKLTRFGWRYINVMPYVRDRGLVPLGGFLNMAVELPKGEPRKLSDLNLELGSPVAEDHVRVRVASKINQATEQEALVLDIDYSKTKNLRIADIEKYARQAHLYSRELFESLVTEAYRSYLRGEAVE